MPLIREAGGAWGFAGFPASCSPGKSFGASQNKFGTACVSSCPEFPVSRAQLLKRILVPALLFLGVAAPTRAGLALCGYLTGQNVVRFVLVDQETGERSPWLFVGDLYHGYMLMRFDAANEVLVLEQGNDEIRVPFGASRSRAELRLTVAPNGNLSLAGRPTTLAELESQLKQYRASGSPVVLDVRTQPGVEAKEALTSVVTMLRDSGANQWVVRVTDVTR